MPNLYKCSQCGGTMTPVDYIINKVCLICAKKNHQEVISKRN